MRLRAMRECMGLFLAIAVALVACASAQPRPGDVYVGKGMFGDIIVYDDARGLRNLEFERGAARHSAVKLGDPLHLEFGYARVALISLAFARRPPERVLVVGLGGGTLPMFLHAVFPRARIDVAEIDPEVARVAKTYFGVVEDNNLRIAVGDGRAFIERAAPASYDIILLDAFGARAVPTHLTTLEFMRAARAALRPDGVVASNLWGERLNDRYVDMLATQRAVFEALYAVRAPNILNEMVFALPRKADISQAELAERARVIGGPPVFRDDLAGYVENGWFNPQPAAARGRVLRD